MKALLIEVDFQTGKRAGGINPRDEALQCYGWQNLDSNPGLEIRLVEDDRDLSQYRDTKGVAILEGKQAINDAIKMNIPTRYKIVDMGLMREHMKEKGLSFDQFANKAMDEIAKIAFAHGIIGVTEQKPKFVE